ncbi:Endonuclease 2 2 isoform 1 [Tripterygium wilfordii]|uniref:Aspergillus nuclease S1 n=1 Tax=Tripterygium wilfordii TaxID=458696 RepID=A0A7J7DZZ5_TRIWF|nr:endonuclease 2 [Tripterygium wilfordii]KAF5751918.1 Endonuclease 2 2 isoform 1 [Tripterygium wilfordii]
MGACRFHIVVAILSLVFLLPGIHGWGADGHHTICKIAQSRLSEAAADAVKELLPAFAENDLASVCSWADQVRFHYHWSAPLHFINTPGVCNFDYNRDCKDEDGVKGRCVAAAINNYTTELLTYKQDSSKSDYNLTESLLFLSHFMGDIHQPLHCGYAADRGGNDIEIHWYTRKQNLHHVWDVNIIETAEERFYDSNVDEFADSIQKNITTGWADLVPKWETCSSNQITCPDVYASESIKAACDWSYKGVTEGSTLEDDYFLSRLPIVKLRLAQGGVRLAATLNRIFS